MTRVHGLQNPVYLLHEAGIEACELTDISLHTHTHTHTQPMCHLTNLMGKFDEYVLQLASSGKCLTDVLH